MRKRKMENEQTLAEKIEEAEKFLPGIKKLLEPDEGGYGGMNWNYAPRDVAYLETDRYKMVAAKWEEHSWSEDGGGVQWEEWFSLFYLLKGSKGEIKQLKTEKIVTRDIQDECKDRRDLWPYIFVGVQLLGQNRVEIFGLNNSGKKGLAYKFDLESGELKGEK